MYSIVSETVNAVCLLTYSGCNVLTTGQSHRRQERGLEPRTSGPQISTDFDQSC